MAIKRNFMQLDCTDEMLAFIDQLEEIHCRGISVWIRAVIELRMNGKAISLGYFLKSRTSPHLSRKTLMEILRSSGFFNIDEAKDKLSFSASSEVFFTRKSPNNTSPAPSKQSEVSLTVPPEQGEVSLTVPPSNAPAYESEENRDKNKDKKEKKEDKKKNAMSILLMAATTPEEKEFYESMLRCYPRVCQMEKPLKYEQYLKILEEFDVYRLADVLKAMENRRDLHRRYISANLTVRNWIKHE